MSKYQFYSDCIGWPGRLGDLRDMVNSGKSIGRRTFLRHVDRDQLRNIESDLSYSPHPSQGLTMAGDWHVDYRRGKLRGRRCYFFVHSAIEFVFTKEAQ